MLSTERPTTSFWNGVVGPAAVAVTFYTTDNSAAFLGTATPFDPEASAMMAVFFFKIGSRQATIFFIKFMTLSGFSQMIGFSGLGILAHFFSKDFS